MKNNIKTEINFSLIDENMKSFDLSEKEDHKLELRKIELQKDLAKSLDFISLETKNIIEPYIIKMLNGFKEKIFKISISFEVFFNENKEIKKIRITYYISNHQVSSFLYYNSYVPVIIVEFNNRIEANRQIIKTFSYFLNLFKENKVHILFTLLNKMYVGRKYSNFFVRIKSKINSNALRYDLEKLFIKNKPETIIKHYIETNKIIAMIVSSPILIDSYCKYEFYTEYMLYPNKKTYSYKITYKKNDRCHANIHHSGNDFLDVNNTQLGVIDGFVNSNFLGFMFKNFIIENGKISKKEFIGLAEVSKIIEY